MAGSFTNLNFQMYYRGAGNPLRIIVYLQAGSSGYSWDSTTSFSMVYQTYRSGATSPALEMGSLPIKPSDMTNRPSYIKNTLSSGEWCTVYDSDYVPNAYTKYSPFWTIPPSGYFKELTIGNTTNTINPTHADQTSTFSIGNNSMTAGVTNPNISITTRAPNYDINMVYEFAAHAGSSRVVLGETTSKTFTDVIPLETFALDNTNSVTKIYDIRMNVYGTRSTGARWQLYHVNPGTATKVSIPSSVVPTISSVTPSDEEDYLNDYGVYVGTKSILQASVSASGLYGSTIIKVEHQIDDLFVSTTSPSITKRIGRINNSGSRTLKTTVTDSRGRTAVRNTEITVVPYTAPTLTVTANRWDTSGNEEDDSSETVRIDIGGNIPSINNHPVYGTIVVYGRQKGTSEWTTIRTITPAVSGTIEETVYAYNQSDEPIWEYRAKLTDVLGTVVEIESSVGVASPILEFHSSGKGMGIGTIAPEVGLDVGMQTNFRGTEEDGYSRIQITDPEGNDSVILANLAGSELQLLLNALGSYDRAKIFSHVFLDNNKTLGAMTTSGDQTSILRMNTSDQVELTWTSGGLKGRVFKQIWTGTWTSGSITVSEAPYYNVFGFNFGNPSGQSWTGLGFRCDSNIHAFTFSWNNSAAPMASVAAKIGISGTKLSLAGKSHVGLWVNAWTMSSTQSNSGITRIWGIL